MTVLGVPHEDLSPGVGVCAGAPPNYVRLALNIEFPLILTEGEAGVVQTHLRSESRIGSVVLMKDGTHELHAGVWGLNSEGDYRGKVPYSNDRGTGAVQFHYEPNIERVSFFVIVPASLLQTIGNACTLTEQGAPQCRPVDDEVNHDPEEDQDVEEIPST